MKAVVIHGAKDLRVEERVPEAPGPNQVEVAIGRGGICGSDLHYYNHGGFGTVRVRHPMVLGHEVAGTVVALGASVSGVEVGDKIAISPSHPCDKCEYCLRGQKNHCADMVFYGSAMRVPHIDGAFRQRLVAGRNQCYKLAGDTTLAEGAFAEPFAVALHAASLAGPLRDRTILVTGSGPIGALCVLAARVHGAREIVVTDVLDDPLVYARAIGADRTINVAVTPEKLSDFAGGKGSVDVVFEASGNAAAFAAALATLRPRGVLVQIGLGGQIELPQSLLVSKEVEIRGSFRFHEEFARAVDLINTRQVDVRPLLSNTFPIEDAVKAFELASDRSRSMKVQLAFA